MASKLLVSCLLFSSCLAAPQSAIGSVANHQARSPLGTFAHHSKTVTDLDGTAQVHRFDSRLHSNVVRVARPRLVTSGPFAVQAFPSQTPVVVGGAGATPVITAARTPDVSSNLFQTPDGRIFAFSNGNQQIAPGQIFQTPDGRFFTTSAISTGTPQVQLQGNADQENNAEVIQEVRDNLEPVQEATTTPAPVAPVSNNNQRNQQQQQQQQQIVLTQSQAGLQSFVAVPQSQIVARAPLTAANSRFVATPLQNHIITHDNVAHHVVAAPSPVRVAGPLVGAPAPVVASPLTTGFFTFPGAGFAFNF